MSEKIMGILDIVKAWLTANADQYDGLVNDDSECACETDDLSPGGCLDEQECKAGHKIPFNRADPDDCPVGDGPCMCEWHMREGRKGDGAPSKDNCPECGLYAGDDSAPHWECAAKASKRILDKNIKLRAENAELRAMLKGGQAEDRGSDKTSAQMKALIAEAKGGGE